MAPVSASTAGAGRVSLSTLNSFVTGLAVAVLASVLPCPPAAATTWTVRADGSGTSGTIQAAVNAAASGDTVDIGPGLFYERVSIVDKSLLVRGAGRNATEINGYPHGNVFAIRGTGNYTEIRGVTIRDGHADVYSDPAGGIYGGGVLGDGAVFALVDCRVTQCFGNLGGAVYATSQRIIPEGGMTRANRARGAAAGPGVPHDVILLRDCLFDENTGGAEGGAFCFEFAWFAVENCEFRANWAGQGGAGRIFDSVGSVSGSLFHDNEALLDGGALETEQSIYFESTSVLISRNTFYANQAGREGSAVIIPLGITIDYVANIFALNTGNASSVISCRPPDGEYNGSCNLFWANTGTATSGCVQLPGDLNADPLFCNAVTGDFRVCENSPALAGDCGNRGAFGAGCTGAGCATVVMPLTWGAIKSRVH